ncbi:MAG: response regulator transcription factor [Cyclobacteriaceae bacterium]
MGKRKILIVDDHKMIRDILKSYIEGQNAEIQEASNGQEALENYKQNDYDLVMTDIDMPEMDGITLSSKILEEKPDQKILVLSMLTDTSYVKKMLKAGVSGYISKEAERDEILQAIETVMAGENYYSKTITNSIMHNIGGKPKVKTRTVLEQPLTKRELEVLHLIIQEYSNEEIAEKLFISKRTVDAHKQNILGKTGAKNIVGLVMHSLERNLFDDIS